MSFLFQRNLLLSCRCCWRVRWLCWFGGRLGRRWWGRRFVHGLVLVAPLARALCVRPVEALKTKAVNHAMVSSLIEK